MCPRVVGQSAPPEDYYPAAKPGFYFYLHTATIKPAVNFDISSLKVIMVYNAGFNNNEISISHLPFFYLPINKCKNRCEDTFYIWSGKGEMY